MIARKFQELEAWQLATELRRQVYAITENRACATDFAFCRQLRAASSSVSANVAEGFERFKPKDFSHFLRIAKGSLAEVQTYVAEAVERGYIAPQHHREVEILCGRTRGAIVGLIRHLEARQRIKR